LERAISRATARGVLRRTQILLLLLIVGLALVRRGEHYWPIVTWPVYALHKPQFPAPTEALLEVRVTTRSGERRVLRSADLVEWSRNRIADLLLEGAVGDRGVDRRPADQAHLARLVALALGHEAFEAIEIWRVEWRVDALGRPPLLRAKPSAETRRAHFVTPWGGAR
jgi:hypothetical protein